MGRTASFDILSAIVHNYMLVAASEYSPTELNNALVRVLSEKKDKKIEVDYVIDHVCTVYKISRKHIMKKYVKGDTAVAKIMCYGILVNTLGFSARYVAMQIFDNQKPQTVAKGLEHIRNMDPKFKHEKDFMDKYEDAKMKLAQFIYNKDKQPDGKN